jgi:molybdopterin-guanine dinucleotide biosynthesis adapter protein
MHPDDPAIIGIASDQPLPAAPIPVIDLDDVEQVTEFLIRHAAPIHAVPAVAERG